MLRHPILRDADKDKLAPVLARVPLRRLAPGEALGLPVGAPQLHLVLSGLLRCYRLASNERQLLLELIPAGGFDGLIRMSGRPGHFTVAVQDSLVVWLDPRVLRRAFAGDPQVAANLVWAAADRLSIREQQIDAISAHDPVIGVASILLMVARRNGIPEGDLTVLPDRLTHQTVAEMLGVRRETVTRALQRLTAQGAVHRLRGRYALDAVVIADVLSI